MKKRLTVPGFQGPLGRVCDIPTVGQAAMVMPVVYQRDSQFFTNRQQVSRCIQSIIVLQGQTAANVLR